MPVPQVWLRQAIESAAGCQAHPIGVPEGLAPPYVVYQRTTTARELTVDDPMGDPAGGSQLPAVAGITVEVFRDDYVAAWEMSQAIVEAIHGYADDEIWSCVVIDEKDADPVFLDGRDITTYCVELTVEIRY